MKLIERIADVVRFIFGIIIAAILFSFVSEERLSSMLNRNQ